MNKALEARDLSKTYKMGKVSVQALAQVSLRIEAGVFVAIQGPSGAGKSTLLHLLAGLDTPTSGEVLWEERVISRMRDSERAKFRNQTIGIIFQFYHLLPELSALENVMLPGVVQHRGDRRQLRQRALTCLEHVRLTRRLHHRPRELSGGEQQRVAIARALVNEPRILLCDEPTGNLDSETGQMIASLLGEVQQRTRMSIVLVTHDAALAQLADQHLILRDGKIVEQSQQAAVRRA
jgi:ABC-type lipoprotein export system ATPase subunit